MTRLWLAVGNQVRDSACPERERGDEEGTEMDVDRCPSCRTLNLHYLPFPLLFLGQYAKTASCCRLVAHSHHASPSPSS